jgi:hypothetical protein
MNLKKVIGWIYVFAGHISGWMLVATAAVLVATVTVTAVVVLLILGDEDRSRRLQNIINSARGG